VKVSPLADPQVEAVLARLHAEDKRQFRSIVRRYLPRALLSPITGRSAVDASAPAEADFLRDKLVAIDPEKGRLAYTFCRALDARRVVEVGTSFGVSTLYLAAALRDNARRDGSARKVIGTEIEPTKAAAARTNIRDAGLGGFVELREGDALVTLADLEGPIDFVLVDTWIPLALPALQLLAPRLRPGAIVMCDNVRQFAKAYRPYTDFVRDPANGFRSMLWPGQGGLELSIRTPARPAQ
jgi:predicted O-methyltransferase YrrM